MDQASYYWPSPIFSDIIIVVQQCHFWFADCFRTKKQWSIFQKSSLLKYVKMFFQTTSVHYAIRSVWCLQKWYHRYLQSRSINSAPWSCPLRIESVEPFMARQSTVLVVEDIGCKPCPFEKLSQRSANITISFITQYVAERTSNDNRTQVLWRSRNNCGLQRI